MAKGISKNLDSTLADEQRRLQKSKQKAQVRKGKKEIKPVFTFADLKHDQRERQNAHRRYTDGIQFGQRVHDQINSWLDAADVADNRGIQVQLLTSTQRQAWIELQAWARRVYGYAINGTMLVNIKAAKAA